MNGKELIWLKQVVPAVEPVGGDLDEFYSLKRKTIVGHPQVYELSTWIIVMS